MRKILTCGLLFGCTVAARAQNFPPTVVKSEGYSLSVRAYIDPSRLPGTKLNPASRYDLQLAQPAGAPYRWDILTPDSPTESFTSSIGEYGANYEKLKKTTIRVTLRQFDTYEERVTFKNLDLTPRPASSRPAQGGPRTLALQEAQSVTTPSGITVTLPTQSGLQPEDWNAAFNGNADALFLHIRVTPNAKSVASLPTSPLFGKHHRPLTIKLEVPEPNLLVYYAADNTFTRLKIGLPNLQNITHLDELTLIVRQRVDLQTVPVEIEVPISKPLPARAEKKS